MLAVYHEHRNVVATLIDHGAELNLLDDKGYTALLYALKAKYPNQNIVTALVSHGGNTACQAFNSTLNVWGANTSVVRNHLKIMIDCDTIDIDQVVFNAMYKMTALMLAAKEGQHDIVIRLLDHGADVNWMEEWEPSALMLAAKYGHEEVVTTLLNQGMSDVEIYNYFIFILRNLKISAVVHLKYF